MDAWFEGCVRFVDWFVRVAELVRWGHWHAPGIRHRDGFCRSTKGEPR